MTDHFDDLLSQAVREQLEFSFDFVRTDLVLVFGRRRGDTP